MDFRDARNAPRRVSRIALEDEEEKVDAEDGFSPAAAIVARTTPRTTRVRAA
jgi:hypothetical protein